MGKGDGSKGRWGPRERGSRKWLKNIRRGLNFTVASALARFRAAESAVREATDDARLALTTACEFAKANWETNVEKLRKLNVCGYIVQDWGGESFISMGPSGQ